MATKNNEVYTKLKKANTPALKDLEKRYKVKEVKKLITDFDKLLKINIYKDVKDPYIFIDKLLFTFNHMNVIIKKELKKYDYMLDEMQPYEYLYFDMFDSLKKYGIEVDQDYKLLNDPDFSGQIEYKDIFYISFVDNTVIIILKNKIEIKFTY